MTVATGAARSPASMAMRCSTSCSVTMPSAIPLVSSTTTIASAWAPSIRSSVSRTLADGGTVSGAARTSCRKGANDENDAVLGSLVLESGMEGPFARFTRVAQGMDADPGEQRQHSQESLGGQDCVADG